MKIVKNTDEFNEEKVIISASEYAGLTSLKYECTELKSERRELKFEHEELESEHRELESKFKELESEYEKLKKRIDWLIEQTLVEKKKKYGSSSEKTDHLQLDLFNEIEVFSDEQGEESEQTDIVAHKRRKKRSKSLISKLPDDLPVDVIECTLPDDDMVCAICGEARHVIGKELARKELVIIPAHVEIREYWQNIFGCRNCENTGTEVPIVKANVPNSVIKGSFASAEAIAHIATQKFVMSSPLHRQEQELKSKNIDLSKQTMSNWLIKATESHLYPIYEKMHKDIKKNDILHADETELQVLREPGKKAQSKSFMWLYRTGNGCSYPIVLYEYQPDRKHKRPREFLDGWSGYLHSDGYAGYKKLPDDVTVVCCFLHARRKFTDALTALKNSPSDDKKKTIAGQGVAYCNKLFDIERNIANLSFDEKKKKRQELSAPIIKKMSTWLDNVNASGKSSTGKALTYLRNQWPYLIKYIDDGRLEISNNRAERSIKPFVIGRKNFLFANTPKGAKASAVLYSIIETAKENGLSPYLYLKYIFSKSPNMDTPDVNVLMPYAPEVQENCKP